VGKLSNLALIFIIRPPDVAVCGLGFHCSYFW